MCGINGIYGLKDEFRTRDLLVHMNQKLAHRGPDAQGILTRGGIGLGHRRLSILDLSENGRQPMANARSSAFISYNGEIYNFRELRKECRDFDWKTNTDTEVILALYDKFGESCFEKLDGMFAIAIWDDAEKKLVLARDRMGKKPLYYAWNGPVMVFSSEIRSLLASQQVEARISPMGLQNYLQFQTVYSPDTLLENVKMLPAGTIATVKGGIMDSRKFWNLDRAKEKFSLTGPYDKVIKQTRELFFQAVEKRMISDVPLGAFLSGGIDSSAVVAAMSQVSQSPIHTFHISFGEGAFSEEKFAHQIAKKYKSDHHSITLTANNFLDELPEAMAAMDHPGLDGPNTYVVSKYAKKAGITVALSGMGGDEIFGGYPVFKYLKSLNKYRVVGKTPVFFRRAMVNLMKKRLPESQRMRLLQFAELKEWDLTHLYGIFRTVFTSEELRQFGLHPQGIKGLELDQSNSQKIITEISVAECKTYLENVLLRDTDQMSMANSLEVRVPFLDKDLVEFVLSLPDDFKPLKPQKKLIIDAMGDLLPEEIWNRKKMGFTFPWKHWVNNELKEFCTQNIGFLQQNSIINASYLQQLLDSLEAPENETWYKVWNATVLAHWIQQNDIKFD